MLKRVRREWATWHAWRLQQQRPFRPLAAGLWMLAAVGVAAAAITMTTMWLLSVANDAPAKEQAKIRVDAVRTGLAAGAGVGAAVGLMLAFHRQRHQEIATVLADHDATERRVTELYNAAAEQLGSDKAPVRLTALYTLERLANDNELHRQTIVNIICAYLRMPYTPTDDTGGSADQQRHAARRYRAARTGVLLPPPEPETDPHEELQVRLTAQRILYTHLQPDAATYWVGMSLDLAGATLIDFTLTFCELDEARFVGATFTGGTNFGEATFTGGADFDEATFTGVAFFVGATFTGGTSFVKTTFHRGAFFIGAVFPGEAAFGGAVFTGEAGSVLPPGWRFENAGDGTRRLVSDPVAGEEDQAAPGRPTG